MRWKKKKMQHTKLLFLGLLLLFAGCGGDQDSRPGAVNEVAANRAGEVFLRELVQEINQARQAGMVDSALVFYEADATLLPPDRSAALSGREAIRQYLEAPSALELEPQKAEVSDRLGYVWASAQSGDTLSRQVVFIFHQTDMADWRIALEVWKP